MKMRFEQKVVLITGAGAGIGRETALAFAREGALVAVNSKRAQTGGETLALLEEYGGGMFVQGDVSDEKHTERIVREVVERFGRLDILVNNAGIVLPGKVHTTAISDWEESFAVNARGVFLMSKYAVLQMLYQKSGVIVNNASVVALKGVPDRAAYAASKGAVVSLTKAMAADYLHDNIRVNCVCPGTVLTPSLQNRIDAFADREKARADFAARQPMGRFGLESEIAEAILFAASDGAAFMHGSILSIDGGMTI